ncbi:Cell division protein FtsZ [Operophtera brumata]|uniref:Cell division protein FtsZ n=1 Tax=Operophtera brumata TaxID=104452 RepID=A0A0L7LGV8_OPEBR|nr:Cell division protein FtsZ [Operophtera brumata]
MIPTGSDIPKRGRITVYNKISGKPYTFEGEIKVIPDSMPYEYGLECLTLDIASLDLIPNSAILQLINRQLVGVPVKAVVGQTKLKSVEMVVYVKLLD